MNETAAIEKPRAGRRERGSDGEHQGAAMKTGKKMQINEFNGRRTVQLKVLDWRAA